MDGRAFYTEPSQHYNCAVGSYTHAIPLPAERAAQLNDTIGFMVSSGYLEMAEVPGIPALPSTPKYVAYAPAASADFPAAVVIAAAKPAQAMLLYEAALRAGAGSALTNVLGRPGCAVVPLAISTGLASLSFGCKGNRTFTGLGDDEMYVAIPGAKWPAVEAALDAIEVANHSMAAHYQSQAALFPILG